MSVRLTEHPLRLGFTVVETAANTFTTTPINLPSVPSIAVSRGEAKAIGVEIMKVRSNLDLPDMEAGQSNSSQAQLSKGPVPTALQAFNDNRSIWHRINTDRGIEVTAVGELYESLETSQFDDLTDGDGNGELIADNEIHISVQGAGNANVKRVRGYLLYHVVELERDEALFELIETAQ